MISVSLTVTNTGAVAGAETVQLWIVPPPTNAANVRRPIRELKAFQKVLLQPSESKQVEMAVTKKLATSYWHEIRDARASEKGEYEVPITGTGAESARASFWVLKTRYWNGL